MRYSLVTFCHVCLLVSGLLLPVGCLPGDEVANADPSEKGDDSGQQSAGDTEHPANRLAKESSPYLLLHAHNPVDWYPWGPEAFAKAKKENKPIFLSIGYSSCYWCHVMERLVFENEKIAEFMNKHFVNVKVDREERPDVDDIYMTSLQVYYQAIGVPRSGGWPLSMFLTPEGKPFVGGTYFPPKDQNGRPGFPTVLNKVQNLWANNENNVRQMADKLTEHVRITMKPRPVLQDVDIDQKMVSNATQTLLETVDWKYGGIGFQESRPDAPKFPTPTKLELLQYAADNADDKQAAKALHLTLDRIAAGGIRDHLGGGFHRYSTDRYWHVPHFEKMLYDQAQLTIAFTQAYQQTGKLSYKEAIEGILRFVRREMTHPRGGFYSALDAETDGVEGEYYVWSPKEVETILGKDDAELFKRVYGMNEPKRFEHGYVLHLPKPLAQVAQQLQTPLPELKLRLAGLRAELLAARDKRKPLLKDDKILTSWNGLMIRGFAEAGRVLKRPEYIDVARKAALFVLTNLRDEQGRLKRSWRKGTAKLNPYLDDYAFLVSGLLALHRATGEEKWLNAARRLTDDQIRDYWSKVGGGFFFTADYHEELIARTRNAYDSVLPSGNAVSVRNLVRLYRHTGKKTYREHARNTIRAFADQLENAPAGTPHLALAVAEFLDAANSKTGSKAETKTPDKQQSDNSKQRKHNHKGEGIRPISGTRSKTDDRKQLVTAQAYLSVDRLPLGGQCRIALLVDIKKDWHINANPPRPKIVIPTMLSLRSPAGVKLTDVQYPKGDKLTLPGFDEPLQVYEGRIVIYGTLKIPEKIKQDRSTDDMELRLRYQACSDTRCLPPKTVTLRGKVPLAPSGASVKKINRKLFAKPKKKERREGKEQ